MAKGKVYLVGAGPGRPDLITVRGLNILRAAEVVIYDCLVPKKMLEVVAEGAELVCSNGFAAAQMVRKARAGKKVVRLKNGDPSIFGRLSQELGVLAKHKIEFEIVPGVTAANAAAAYSGIPLTDRRFSSSVIFVTGHEDPNKKKSLLDWGKIASFSTIVLYMAVENLSEIVKKLLKAGQSGDRPAVAVSQAGEINQKIVKGKLENIAKKVKEGGIHPPAIIIIGETAGLEKSFNRQKKSKRVLFAGLSPERFFLGGNYWHLPLIRIEPLQNYDEFDRYLKRIREFAWIVFSSRYGAQYFFERLQAIGLDARDLKGIKIAAIGNSTRRRLLDFGIRADLIPKKESSAGLLAEFKKIDLERQRVFLPRSDIADKGLQAGLEKLRAKVTSSFAYRNLKPNDLPDLDLDSFDRIVFTSPSTVRNFKKRYKKLPKGIKLSWIGEKTKKEVAKL